MFLRNHIDWSHPLFRQWKLPEKLSKSQSDAFLDGDDNEIINAPWTEDELRDICLNLYCRVDLRRGNICAKAKKKWPRTIFKKEKYKDLTRAEKNILHAKLESRGPRLYNSCVDINQVKKSCKHISRNALDPRKQARFLKRRFYQIMRPDNDPYAVQKQHPENSTQAQSEDDDNDSAVLVIDEEAVVDDLSESSFLAESEMEIVPIEEIEVVGLPKKPRESKARPLSIRNRTINEWITSQQLSLPQIAQDLAVDQGHGIAEDILSDDENNKNILNTNESVDTVIFTGNQAQKSQGSILSQVAEYGTEHSSGNFATIDSFSESSNFHGQFVEPVRNTEVVYKLSSEKLKNVQTNVKNRRTNIQISMNTLEMLPNDVTPLERLPVCDDYNEVDNANCSVNQSELFENLDGYATSTQK